jgi:hypothetical protein
MHLSLIATHCGRPVTALRTIQKTFALHIPADGVYSEAYCRFLEKIVALLALHVSRTALLEIFEKEKQILRLLHVDTLSSSPTWYLDDCALPLPSAHGPPRSAPALSLPAVSLSNPSKGSPLTSTRLLLTGHDLGFKLDAPATQDTLDFGSREKELFNGTEMGEDVRKLLADYLRLFTAIRQTVSTEIPVIRNALNWASRLS